MALPLTSYGRPFPRRQAQLLSGLLGRPESPLRSVLTGRRREGKSDLLLQIQALLFEQADGPMPFRYAFDYRRDAAVQARHFAASFCQQMRAFSMRQPEMLDEPLALLETELERPGLPLALSELGRDYLALSPANQMEFAAAFPAQFACREGRPVCLLLDNAEKFDRAGEILAYLDDQRLSWLVTGRRPQLQRLAALRGWSVTALQPLSVPEALALAEDRCRQFELPFVADVWRDWFEIAGTSPWWAHRLMEAAISGGRTLDSTIELWRAYIQELSSGGLGEWLHGRWQAAVPAGEDSAPAMEVVRPGQVIEVLLQTPLEITGLPTGLLNRLANEEWVEQAAAGVSVCLDAIERDWLVLNRLSSSFGSRRAAANLLQACLLRSEETRPWRQAGSLLRAIREALLALPQSQLSFSGTAPLDSQLPGIISVVEESAGGALLFWCYGSRPERSGRAKDRPGAASLHLIALCSQQPAEASVKQWNRRLNEEADTFHAGSTGTAGGAFRELWLILPEGASQKPATLERRMSWEELAALLGVEVSPAGEGLSANTTHRLGVENQKRLAELETRAQWLEEELANAREQFHKETSRNLLAAKPPKGPEIPPASGTIGEGEAERLQLLADLLRSLAELLAAKMPGDLSVTSSIREIQERAGWLAGHLPEPDAGEREGKPLKLRNPAPGQE